MIDASTDRLIPLTQSEAVTADGDDDDMEAKPNSERENEERGLA
jgi:hypothetical protein